MTRPSCSLLPCLAVDPSRLQATSLCPACTNCCSADTSCFPALQLTCPAFLPCSCQATLQLSSCSADTSCAPALQLSPGLGLGGLPPLITSPDALDMFLSTLEQESQQQQQQQRRAQVSASVCRPQLWQVTCAVLVPGWCGMF